MPVTKLESLEAGDIPAGGADGIVKLRLAAAGDEDISALFDKELRGSERHSGGGGSDDGGFSIEFSHRV
jgi:hypothetical protein